MKIYWPEAFGEKADSVGYNHAVMLLFQTLREYFTNDLAEANCRMYCNIPWHHDPKWLKTERKLPIIVYSMYESTKLPATWVSFLNKHSTVVLVPSIFCYETFRTSGVNKPIYIVSLGVDIENIPDCSKKSTKDSPYIFYWQGVAYDPKGRKGVDIVERAFLELKAEGKLKEQDRLILKYKPHEKAIKFGEFKLPSGIEHIQENLSRDVYYKLLQSVDLCIFPTHGEGFGFLPLECMAAGKPVAVTNFSMPYVYRNTCFPLRYKMEKSKVGWNHRHFAFNGNGIQFNLTGLMKNITWMPKKLLHLPVSGDQIFTANGLEKVTGFHLINHILNFIGKIQDKFGLYLRPRTPITIFQENPGQDAYVNVEWLKHIMMECYNNRDETEDIGFLAREYAKRNWSLNRIQDDFENIKPLIQGALYGK